MLVSVLIPVRNEAAHIGETVRAMQTQKLDGHVELLFMDGRSEDGTREILHGLARDDARIRVLDNPGRTTPAGLNVGLRNARGRYVARMDGHTVYPPTYLAHGIERLQRGDVEWVSGPQIPDGDGTWSRRVALALSTRLGTGSSSKWATGTDTDPTGDEVDLDTGVFAGVWLRSTLKRHGGWAEEWPINQDSELAARVLRAGGRIVCLPEMGARYMPRDSLGGLVRQYWRYGMYRAKTARRHPESLRPSLVLAPGLGLTLLTGVAAPRPLRRTAHKCLGAYVAAISVTSLRVARRAGVRDAASLPVVFATMHLAWGLGFVFGCLRFGPPVAALLHLGRASAAGSGDCDSRARAEERAGPTGAR